MANQWVDLNRQRRTLAIKVYARDKTDPDYTCPVCHQPIHWDLPYKDPDTGLVNRYSKSVDHAQERQDGGALLDPDNCWTAHLRCNSSKGAARRHEREKEQRQSSSPLQAIHIDPATL